MNKNMKNLMKSSIFKALKKIFKRSEVCFIFIIIILIQFILYLKETNWQLNKVG